MSAKRKKLFCFSFSTLPSSSFFFFSFLALFLSSNFFLLTNNNEPRPGSLSSSDAHQKSHKQTCSKTNNTSKKPVETNTTYILVCRELIYFQNENEMEKKSMQWLHHVQLYFLAFFYKVS